MNDSESILNLKRTVHQQIGKVQQKNEEVNNLSKTLPMWWTGEVADAFDESYKKLMKQLEYEYNIVMKLENSLSELSVEVARAMSEEKQKRKGLK